MELNNEIGLDGDILIYLTTRLMDLSFYPFSVLGCILLLGFLLALASTAKTAQQKAAG